MIMYTIASKHDHLESNTVRDAFYVYNVSHFYSIVVRIIIILMDFYSHPCEKFGRNSFKFAEFLFFQESANLFKGALVYYVAQQGGGTV